MTEKKLKIAFLGTPEIACPFLNRIASGGHAVCGVISQPDRPQGRGMKLCCPPVKNAAGALDIEVFQPAADEDLVFALKELAPDLGVVVAYGRRINKEALAVPRLGLINLHFSLLPAYRGAAPVQRALMNGETVTGVTVFWLEEGMDTGPVFSSREVAVSADDYAPGLFAKLTSAGLELLGECLAEISAGRLIRTPQSGAATLAPKIGRGEVWLDFGAPAAELRNRVRGLACGPRARFGFSAGGRAGSAQVLRCSLASPPGPHGAAAPGEITAIEREKGFFIQCGGGQLLVEEVQPEGGRPMKAADFLNGVRLGPGDRLGPKESL